MRGLTTAALKSPAAVAVGVAVAILFGAFALYSLPIQLFPDIDRPQIGIETDWRAETPREVESQLVQPEEDVLQGLPGLQEMDGYSNSGGGYVALTFALGTDMKATLVDVIGRLNRLPPLPADAQKPIVQLASSQDSNATLLYVFMQKLPGNSRKVSDYEPFLKNVVIPRIEAVPGVGSARIVSNGDVEELDIVFDPVRAAELGIQIPKMAQQITGSGLTLTEYLPLHGLDGCPLQNGELSRIEPVEAACQQCVERARRLRSTVLGRVGEELLDEERVPARGAEDP